MHLRSLLIGLLALAMTGSAARAENWPRFRGPNGSGIAPAIAIGNTWSADDYRWTTDLPGEGHSSPVIWENRLFLTSADERGGRRMVHCLDTHDGKILWTHPFESTKYKKHVRNSYASATPAVDAERVYVCWGTPDDYLFVALDHAGNEVWRRDLGPYGGGHGAACSPIVYRDMVVLANMRPRSGFIVALDGRTGEERWKSPRTQDSKPPYSTPCVFDQPGVGEVLVFTDAQVGIEAVSPRNGAELWAFDVFDKSEDLRAIGSPIVAGQRVLGSAGFVGGKKMVVCVDPLRSSAGSSDAVVWSTDRNAPQIPTPLAKDDLVYLWSDQGIVTCVELADGKTVWQKRVGGDFFGSPIAIGNRIVAVSEQGEAVVLAASRDYAELGRTSLGAPSSSTPAAADGVLYLRTLSRVIAVGRKGK